jgi:hypothetical protein
MIQLYVVDHHYRLGGAGLRHTSQPVAPAVQQHGAAWMDTQLQKSQKINTQNWKCYFC